MPALLELTMKNSIFIFIFCFSGYFPKATTGSETVWLKDITTRLQTDKRTLSDPDLPGELSFILQRKSNTLTLNLKRNYNIDPNADMYIVRKLDDGRSILEKTDSVEKENVAYYQDRDNGAFMTARCVKRSNGQCDILIARLSTVLESLQTYANRHENRCSRFKSDNGFCQFFKSAVGLYKRKKEYYVKVLLVLDSSIWDLFLSLVNPSYGITEREDRAKHHIKRYHSHIMNGADGLYQGIGDPDIAINIKLRGFAIYQWEAHFPHNHSKVHEEEGKKMINASLYIMDLFRLERSGVLPLVPEYDQVMLISRLWMYTKDKSERQGGLSFRGRVCLPGYRVAIAQFSDYFRTTSTVAHELGHSLGAFHDGDERDENAKACKAEDGYIMIPKQQTFDPKKQYSKNPWQFSTCSVNAFKKTLADKECVTRRPYYTQADLNQWDKFMQIVLGHKYPPDIQCQLIMGYGSKLCGVPDERICRFMRCSIPATTTCAKDYFSAATGTSCGTNKWCKQGECVDKDPK